MTGKHGDDENKQRSTGTKAQRRRQKYEQQRDAASNNHPKNVFHNFENKVVLKLNRIKMKLNVSSHRHL